ncbi:hypothetical protein FISHEDRAFT_25953, partial [Fistulina hepatica ATCC 64428]
MPKEATKTKRKSAKSDAPRKGTRAKKDPNAPKRPLSAYMFFSQDWRDRVRAENPDATFGEVGKLLGAKWKEMNDDDKKPYTQQAKADKVRAEKEKEAYEKKKKSGGSDDAEDDE